MSTAIVRGEGEETARQLMAALEHGARLGTVAASPSATRNESAATPPAPVIRDLDAYRVGWELIDHARYSYWGGLRAVVVQFSRGCPHLCNYCGQRGFWTRWRHRDPVRFAAELARLHREHGVKVINFADENPTVSKKAWRAFLEALIAENVDLILVGSTRADDIVRDADILHLYKQAGWQRFLLGMENTDEETLELIRKGATTTTDREAIRLLRQHGILSMATWVVGFEEETDRDHWRGLRQLLVLRSRPDPDALRHAAPLDAVFPAGGRPPRDPDRPAPLGLQAPGAGDAPHAAVAGAAVVQVHRDGGAGRPKALRACCSIRDSGLRHAMRWYTQHGAPGLAARNLGFPARSQAEGWPTVAEFWGAPQDSEEESMSAARPERRVGVREGHESPCLPTRGIAEATAFDGNAKPFSRSCGYWARLLDDRPGNQIISFPVAESKKNRRGPRHGREHKVATLKVLASHGAAGPRSPRQADIAISPLAARTGTPASGAWPDASGDQIFGQAMCRGTTRDGRSRQRAAIFSGRSKP